MKPNSKVFLEAARLQFLYLTKHKYNVYACDNIGTARTTVLKLIETDYIGTPEHDFFHDYFRPTIDEFFNYVNDGSVGFWNRADQEERILALLLCAEILKTE